MLRLYAFLGCRHDACVGGHLYGVCGGNSPGLYPGHGAVFQRCNSSSVCSRARLCSC